MSDETRGYLAIGGTFKFPDEARSIGFLIIQCANLDMSVPAMIANILEIDVADAHTMMRQVDSISTKLAIAKEMAERHPGKLASKAFLQHLGPIQEGLSLRNDLAHGLYFHVPEKSALLLATGMTQSRKGKPKDRLIDFAEIERVARALGKAVHAIFELAPVPVGKVSYESAKPQQASAPSNLPKERRPKARKERKLRKPRPPSAG